MSITGEHSLGLAWGAQCVLAAIQDAGCGVRAKKATVFAQLENICIKKLKLK